MYTALTYITQLFLSIKMLYIIHILCIFCIYNSYSRILDHGIKNIHLNNWRFYFYISEYSTYAHIEITKNGYRHLLLDGYTFGELKVTDQSVHWRCTSNIRDPIKNKFKRCITHVTTRILNGYEMVKNAHVVHTHPPRERK